MAKPEETGGAPTEAASSQVANPCIAVDHDWQQFPAEVVIFDLDDTLAESKAPISDRMVSLLVQLLDHSTVCIISGARFEQFRTQVLKRLASTATDLTRLHIMPTCGTRYYRYDGDEWQLIYSEDLSPETKDEIRDVLLSGARSLGLLESNTWGEIIEDRDSQITFSALGQKAPVPAKSAWDPDGSKKARLRSYAASRLPELEVRTGGSTSIDVTRKGIDKAHGVRKLMEHLNVSIDKLLFVGDRLQPDGNDYPVRQLGVRCVEVSNSIETAEWLTALLTLPRKGTAIPI